MKSICNQIHFTLYKKRIDLADEAGNKVSDKVRLEVYNQSSSETSKIKIEFISDVRKEIENNLKK